MEKGFQVEREILEICYSNGYLPQKNKPRIEHDDTIDIDPEDESDWYMKISLFYYQNTRNFKPLSTILQGCLYIVVRFIAVFSTLTP
ncbi:hypothetical protein VN0859_01340 [Helicobacter pylori]